MLFSANTNFEYIFIDYLIYFFIDFALHLDQNQYKIAVINVNGCISDAQSEVISC